MVVRLGRGIAARYVDDFFGIRKLGCKVQTLDLLDLVCFLCGWPLDPTKSQKSLQSMVVLGCRVVMCWSRRGYWLFVDEEKAARWLQALSEYLRSGVMTAAEASQMAGRLMWSCQVTHDKCGRAYLRSLFAQANAPLPGNVISPRLRRSLMFWHQFLQLKRKFLVSTDDLHRPHVLVWGDASGEQRTLGIVLSGRGKLFYTHYTLPDEVMQQTLQRRNHGINIQELLVVPLLIGTFAKEVEGSLLTYFGDAEGVNAVLLSGSACAEDMAQVVGMCWLELARLRVGFFCHRVESLANISDGPSRLDVSVVEDIGAKYVAPVMPAWVGDIWRIPVEELGE